jgi:hypothetical protein
MVVDVEICAAHKSLIRRHGPGLDRRGCRASARCVGTMHRSMLAGSAQYGSVNAHWRTGTRGSTMSTRMRRATSSARPCGAGDPVTHLLQRSPGPLKSRRQYVGSRAVRARGCGPFDVDHVVKRAQGIRLQSRPPACEAINCVEVQITCFSLLWACPSYGDLSPLANFLTLSTRRDSASIPVCRAPERHQPFTKATGVTMNPKAR